MKPLVMQMLGAPRSGTNYLQWILARSFRDLIIVSYGKHWSAADAIMNNLKDGKDEHLLASYLSSLAKERTPSQLCVHASIQSSFDTSHMGVNDNPTYATDEVVEIVRDAVTTEQVEFLLNVKHPAATFMSWANAWDRRDQHKQWAVGWNRFHKEWLRFFTRLDRGHVVRYEDLLFSTSTTIHDLMYRWSGLAERFCSDIPVPTMSMTTGASLSDRPFIKKMYYWREEFFSELRQEELVSIRENIDQDLWRLFGYSPERNIGRHH